MHPQFGQFMNDATALTRAGDLKAAMAAIAAALEQRPASVSPAPRQCDDVIDVQARVVDGGTPPPTARATPGPAPEVVRGHYAHRAGARDYRLFVPPVLSGKPRALILMLHGCTQNPDDFARGTRMDGLAAQHNALVLYPAQTRQANSQGCWNWFKHNHQGRDRGEPALLAGMARHIADSHGVAPDRIFVAGLSAGGAMAAILASTHPDVFAAAGVHSGLAAGAARDLPGALAAMKGNGTSQPVAQAGPLARVIVFHGSADATVHPSNGDHVANAHRGHAAAGADEQSRLQAGSRSCTRRVHKDVTGRVVTEQWLVQGAGHAWFGGDPSGSYADARGPDASAEMLRFFFETER